MSDPGRFRVATYNIHKCRGMDGRLDPARIVEVLRAVDADIVALQEVVGPGGNLDHAAFIAGELGLHSSLGENRRLQGGAYGNLVLTRAAPRAVLNHDISVPGREPRGCLRVDLVIADRLLHVFNLHLGTSYRERREQARVLLSPAVLQRASLAGSRLVLGDFNEWIRGPATRRLSAELQSADVKLHLGFGRTYPGLLRFLHLDHVYFDPALHLRGMELHRSRTALLASDHLPLVADFQW